MLRSYNGDLQIFYCFPIGSVAVSLWESHRSLSTKMLDLDDLENWQ